MVTQLRIYESDSFDPYVNLAAEKHLMDITPAGTCILYLWQNQNTVVIGRNQNAWAECRSSLLEEEGGRLARRLSGGGAVFHDLGNLNFTFIMCKEDYDLDKQIAVIQKACLLAGIQAEKSGRNDILADGRKFSGNADKEKLGRYLSPPKAKLEAKGVASVRSRVVNLKELAPELTTQKMKGYMAQAFAEVYGLDATPLVLSDGDLAAIEQLKAQYCTWEYLFGAPLPFTFSCEGHFPWGHIQLQLSAKEGIIGGVKLYSDAMDWALPEIVETALTGCRFNLVDMQAALRSSPLDATICNALVDFLQEKFL